MPCRPAPRPPSGESQADGIPSGLWNADLVRDGGAADIVIAASAIADGGTALSVDHIAAVTDLSHEDVAPTS